MAEEETQPAPPLTYAQIQKQSYEGRAQAVKTNFTSDNLKSLGFVSSAYESYMQSTWIGQGLRYGIDRGRFYDPDEANADPEFNVYGHYLDNKDTHSDMEVFVKNGYFDTVYSEAQYNRRREVLQDQVKQKESLSNANTVGVLLGGVASIVDISSLVPGYNLIKKVKVAGRLGRIITSKPAQFGVMGAQQSVVQEVGLHVLNDLQTIEESAINTMFTAALGGGIGVFVSARNPASKLNPKNPEFVFNKDNRIRAGFRQFGESMSESSVYQSAKGKAEGSVEAVLDTSYGQSLSAAAVSGRQNALAIAGKVSGPIRKGVSAFGKGGVALITKTVGQATPIIRMANATSDKVKGISRGLFDHGGILSENNAKGFADMSVESLARMVQQRYMITVEVPLGDAFRELQLAVAALTNKGKAGMAVDKTKRGLGAAADLAKDVARGPNASGLKGTTPTETGTLTMERFTYLTGRFAYGDVDNALLKEYVDLFGQEATDIMVASAKKQASALMKHNDEFADELIKKGMMSPEDKVDFYVAPQKWLGKQITANRAEAKDFFMRLFMEDPEEQFLIDAYGITKEQFEALGKADVVLKRTNAKGEEVVETITADEGIEYRLELLEDWSADLGLDMDRTLLLALEHAEMAAEASQKEAVRAASELRSNNTQVKNASIKEAVTLVRASVAKIARKKKLQKVLKDRKKRAEAEIAKLKEELKSHDQEMKKAIKGGDNPTVVKAESNVVEAEAMLDLFETAGSNASAKDVDAARLSLTEADATLRALKSKSTSDAQRLKLIKLIKKPVRTNRFSYLEGKLSEINKSIKRSEQAIAKMEGELGPISTKVETAVRNRQTLEMTRKLRNQGLRDAQKGARKAKRNLKKMKRLVKKKANEKPLDNYIDDLLDMLAKRNSGNTPLSRMADEVGESSRLKKRMINLNSAQRLEAQKLGILSDDILGDTRQAMADVSMRMALRDQFSQYGNSVDDIKTNMLRDVSKDYEGLIKRAEKAGDDKAVKKLTKEKRNREKDIDKSIDRLMGRLDMPRDPESMMGFLVSKAREWNYIRFGSGFLIPSLTDVSNTALSTGFGTFSRRNLAQAHRTMMGMGNDEIRRLVYAMELMNHNNRSMTFTGSDDLRLQSGVGDLGTWKHYTTSTADRVARELADATTMASGMRWWNSRLKLMAMVEQQHNIIRIIDNYDELLLGLERSLQKGASAKDLEAARDISNLASTGIGQDQIRRMKKLMGNNKPKFNQYGVLELDFGKWKDMGAEGQLAHNDVLMALEMSANRAVMTPTKGDTPFFMSNEYAKTFMQFQTYGFVIMTKYMVPAFQRMANYGDLQAFGTFGLALATGSTVVAAKDLIRGGELQERTMAEWSYETIDRSGFLTFLSAPIEGTKFAFGMDGGSRYQNVSGRLGFLGGPTGGLVNDLLDFTTAEDNERRLEVANKLTPFKIYQQIFDVIRGGDD